MNRVPVSAVVLTFNEAVNLPDCLASLYGWVGEIVVVDSGSTDETLEIARRLADRVYEHPFESYGEQRNWAQQLPLQHEWVLHVDADERVTPELARSIREFLSGDGARCAGAMFSRRTVFLGRWIRHGGQYPAYHLRLFRRDRGRCEDRLYDQHFLVDGPVARLSGDLIDVVAPDLDTWSIKHIRWAGAEARELRRTGEPRGGQVPARLGPDPIARRRWYRNHLFGKTPPFLRALLYFVYRYVVRGGFRDGPEGLIFHVLHGFWYRFYVDARMWEMARRDPPALESHDVPVQPARSPN